MTVERGNIAIGILVGIILVALLAIMPVSGGLLALDGSLGLLIIGIVTGAITRGAGRGLLAGVVSGLAGAILLSIIFFATSGLYASSSLAMISGRGLLASGVRSTLIGIALVALGGLIGGALVPAVSAVEKTEMVYTRNQDKVDDDEEDENGDEEEDEQNDISSDILKRRYANGEITKKQYYEMRKELEE